MGKRRALVGIGLLVSLIASGCASEAGTPAAGSVELEPATARGLAAAVIHHLDQDQVTGVAGSDDGALSVMIDTRRPSMRTVHVQVTPARSEVAGGQCGLDSGYVEVECLDARGLFEVVKRANGDDEMPSLMGRYYDRDRGSILVQTWGSADPNAEELIRSLLSDPLVGEHTSAAVNAEGAGMTEFDELESSLTAEVIGPDGP